MELKFNAYKLIAEAVEKAVDSVETFGDSDENEATVATVSDICMNELTKIIEFPTHQQGGMCFRSRDIVREYMQIGVRWGLLHAYKHTDTPDIHSIREHVTNDVLNSLCDILDFE